MKLSSRVLLWGNLQSPRQRDPAARAALSRSRMLVLEDLTRTSSRWRRESLSSSVRGRGPHLASSARERQAAEMMRELEWSSWEMIRPTVSL